MAGELDFTAELDALETQKPPVPVAAPATSLDFAADLDALDQSRARETARLNYNVTETRNPDTEAKVVDLSSKLGWTPDHVRDRLPQAEAEANRPDWSSLHPGTLDFMAGHSTNAALVRDDIPNVDRVAVGVGKAQSTLKIFDDTPVPPQAGFASVLEAVSTGAKVGGAGVLSGVVGVAQGVAGYATRVLGEDGRMGASARGLGAMNEKLAGYAEEILPGVTQGDVTPFSAASALGSQAIFLSPALGARLASNLLPRFAPLAGRAATIGGEVWATASEAVTEAGNAYIEARNNGATEQQAGAVADKVGVANLALLGVTNRLGLFSDNAAALSPIFEGAQEFGQEIAPELAKASEGLEAVTGPELINKAVGAGTLGAVLGLGGGLAMDVLPSMRQSVKAKERAAMFAEDQKTLNTAVNEAKLKARSETAMQDFLAKQFGAADEVFIPGAVAVENAEVLAKLGVDAAQVEKAEALGGEIRVTLSEMHSKLAPEEFLGLIDNVRPGPDALTNKEAAKVQEGVGIADQFELYQERTAQDSEFADELTRIGDEQFSAIRQTYLAKGADEVTASAEAQRDTADALAMLASFANNPDVFPTHEARLRALKNYAGVRFEQRDEAAETIKRLRMTQRGLFPDVDQGKSLNTFLRSKGGVLDEGGELKAMDVKGTLRRTTGGISVDRAGELAWEAGYFSERPTESDVLEAIREELQGAPLYPVGNEDAQATIEEYKNELRIAENALSQAGLTLDSPIADVRAALQGVLFQPGKLDAMRAELAQHVATLGTPPTTIRQTVDKIVRGLKKAGAKDEDIDTDSSRVSKSTYITYQYGEDESGEPLKLKIRVSDHALPGQYERSDWHFGKDPVDGMFLEDWPAAVADAVRLDPRLSETEVAKAYARAKTLKSDIAQEEQRAASDRKQSAAESAFARAVALSAEDFARLAARAQNLGGKDKNKKARDFAASLGIKIESANDLPALVEKAKKERENPTLFQAAQGSFAPPTGVTTLFATANRSTIHHEMAHFFWTQIEQVVASGEATEELRADYDLLRSWLGAKEGEPLTRAQHEQFADGYETYLAEGKAPNAELKPLFERFKNFMIQIYRSLAAMRVQLTPEIRAVYGRLLATKEEIDLYSEEVGARGPSAKEVETLGLSDEDRKYASRLEADMKKRAVAILQERRDEGMRALKRQWISEAETEVAAERVHRVRDALAAEGMGLDLGDVSAIYGSEAVRDINAKRVGVKLVEDGGQMVEAVAAEFGYETPADMIEELRTAPTKTQRKRDLVAAKTAAHDGTFTPEAPMIDNAALEALLRFYGRKIAAKTGVIKEERARADFIAAEADLAARMDQGRKTLQEARQDATGRIKAFDKRNNSASLKAWARNELNARPVKEAVNTKLHIGNFRRAVREMHAAIAKADWPNAERLNEQAIINFHLANASLDAKNFYDEARKDAPKLTREKGSTIALAYREKLTDILHRAGLTAKRPAGPVLALADLAGEKSPYFQDGVSFSTFPELNTTRLEDLPLWQAQEIMDAVRWLAWAGRQAQKGEKQALTSMGGEAKADVVAKLLVALRKLPGAPKIDPAKLSGLWRKWKNVLFNNADAIQALAFLQAADGFAGPKGAQGPHYDYIYTALNNGQNKLGELDRYWGKPIMDLMSNQFRGRMFSPLGLSREVETAVPLPNNLRAKGQSSWTFANVVSLALNMGTLDNWQKLLDGYGLTDAQARQLIATLSKEDMDAVQEIWDRVGKAFPELSATFERINGRRLPKVEAMAFTDHHGIERAGGYFPLMYDRKVSTVVVTPEMVDAAKAELKRLGMDPEQIAAMVSGIQTGTQYENRQAWEALIEDVPALAGRFEVRAESNPAQMDVSEIEMRADTADAAFGPIRIQGAATVERKATAGRRPVLLDPMQVLSRHINFVSHYVAYAEAVRDVDRILNVSEYASELRDKFGQDFIDVTMKALLRRLAGLDRERDLTKGLRRVKHLVTNYILFWNLKVAATQYAAMPTIIHELGGEVEGAAAFMAGVQHMVELGPLEAHRQLKELIPSIARRAGMIDYDLQEKWGGPYQNWLNRVGQVGALGSIIADASIMEPAVWARYNQVMEATGDQKAAVREAERLAKMIQPFHEELDRSAMQQSPNAMLQLLNMFSSASYNIYNRMWLYEQGRKAGTLPRAEYVRNIVYTGIMQPIYLSALGGAFLMLKGGDDRKPKEKLKDMAIDTVMYLPGQIPGPAGWAIGFGTDVAKAATSKKVQYGPRLDTPMRTGVRIMENAANSIATLARDTKDKKKKEKALYAFAEVAALISGVPATRLWRDYKAYTGKKKR